MSDIAPEPGVEDATRRTHLAAERTWLAWWRTGIASLAAGVAIGRLLPELTGDTTWPYALVGAGYAIVGVAMVVFGELRHRDLARALRTGTYRELDDTSLRTFTIFGVVLGIATIVLILLEL